MKSFIARLLGNEDPTVKILRTELAYAKRIESLCNELLYEEKGETKRLDLNDVLSHVASLRYQAKAIIRQMRSWKVRGRFYDREKYETIGLWNLEAIDKFQKDSSELRRRFRIVAQR